MNDSAGGPPTFADRLDHLWRTVHPRGAKPYSYEYVATHMAELGCDISATYLWQLRKGERDNPTLHHITGIAAFFGVPPTYFLDDAVAEDTNERLEALAAMRDAGVRGLALRAHGLTKDDLAALTTMADALGGARRRPTDE